MAKNAIFQYFLNFDEVAQSHLAKQGQFYKGDGIPEWAQYSVAYFKEYAKRHDVDYFFFEDRFVESTSNYFEVLRSFKDPMFDQYDNVLYLDVDVMPKNLDASIFDVPVVDIAGWPEWRHPDLKVAVNWSISPPLQKRFADFGAPIVPSKTTNSQIRMINSGVVLWSKQARLKAREQFDDHEKWFHHNNPLIDRSLTNVGHSSFCLDQPYHNAMWNKFNFDVLELDMEWNRFPTHDENRKCNFAHYVGEHRLQIPNIFEDIR